MSNKPEDTKKLFPTGQSHPHDKRPDERVEDALTQPSAAEPGDHVEVVPEAGPGVPLWTPAEMAKMQSGSALDPDDMDDDFASLSSPTQPNSSLSSVDLSARQDDENPSAGVLRRLDASDIIRASHAAANAKSPLTEVPTTPPVLVPPTEIQPPLEAFVPHIEVPPSTAEAAPPPRPAGQRPNSGFIQLDEEEPPEDMVDLSSPDLRLPEQTASKKEGNGGDAAPQPKPAGFRPSTKLAGRGRPQTMLASSEPYPLDTDVPGVGGAAASAAQAKSPTDSDGDSAKIAPMSQGATGDSSESGLSVERAIARLKQKKRAPADSDVDLLHDHSSELNDDQRAAISNVMASDAAGLSPEGAEEEHGTLSTTEAAQLTRGQRAQPADEEDEGKGALPAPVRSGSGLTPWLGGASIGALVGGATVLLLTSLLGGSSTPKTTVPETPGHDTQAHVAPAVASGPKETIENAQVYVRGGDFDKALPLLKSEGAEPGRLALRGEATWLTYLRQKQQTKGQIKEEDTEVQAAVGDLTAARDADPDGWATYWLAQIKEAVNKTADARTLYSEGLTRFPAKKQLFQSALNRLELRAESATEVQSRRTADPAAVLAVALTALQEVPPQPGPAAPAVAGDADAEEAGFAFWAALKACRKNDYKTAVDALQRAKELHGARRYANLRKSQNPLSDPTEEIFLHSCDELIACLQLRTRLKESGLPSAPAALAKVLDSVKKNAELAKRLMDKLQELKIEADDPIKGVTQLLTEKKASDDLVASVKAELESEKVAIDAKDLAKGIKELVKKSKEAAVAREMLEKKLTKANERLARANVKADDLETGIDRLATARDELNQTIQEIARKLGRDGSDRTALVAALDRQTRGSSAPFADAVAQVCIQVSRVAADASIVLQHAAGQATRTIVATQLPKGLPIMTTRRPLKPQAEQPQGDLSTAERFYASALALYQSSRYADAEKELSQALQHNQDARYCYYLGLAQFAQGKREQAAESFRRGVALELHNQPDSMSVNEALERVQGMQRMAINQYRP